MTVIGLVVVAVYGLIVTSWKVFHVLLLFYQSKRYFLGADAPRLRGPDGPLVSILLPAKDEAANIGSCVRSVLDAEYTNFELIVIDDRSADATGAEVVRAGRGDPRLKLIRIEDLPAGWTGKMNAVRRGLERARGDLILIMDADTRHSHEALGTALAVRRGTKGRELDLLSLLPRFEHRSLVSGVVQPLVGALIFVWKPLPWVNSRKRTGVAMAWGGFLLIRRQVLEAVGGLEAVRDRFAADIAIARLVKRAGFRARVFHAPALIQTYMYATTREMVDGWARILRITTDNRVSWMGMTLAALIVGCLSAYAAIGAGAWALFHGGRPPLALALGGMGLMHLAAQLTLLGRFYRISGSHPLYVVGHLPAVLLTCHLVVLGMIRSRRTRLTWRGTSYDLGREGQARSSENRPHFGAGGPPNRRDVAPRGRGGEAVS